jgi:hypothetical protein
MEHDSVRDQRPVVLGFQAAFLVLFSQIAVHKNSLTIGDERLLERRSRTEEHT